MSDLKTTKTYDINEFLSWHKRDELILSPKYQRNSVWNQKAKSYLIDTIIRGLPIPPVFIQQRIDVSASKTFREVIDGQQRLRTIIEFVNNEFPILKSHNSSYGGNTYDDLDNEGKEKILGFELAVELVKAKDEAIIYDMFARLNTNSMTLNKQELRNAKYWGDFKVYIYTKTKHYKQLFTDIGTFSNSQFARMNDAEFISGLTILTMDGIVSETSSLIDNYYKVYDEEFLIREKIEKQMDSVINVIKYLLDHDISQIKFFHRKVAFYTLYSVILNQMFQVKNTIELQKENDFSFENIETHKNKLRSSIVEFESYIERVQNEKENLSDSIIVRFSKFLELHRTRTTSIKERVQRVTFLNNYLLGIDLP